MKFLLALIITSHFATHKSAADTSTQRYKHELFTNVTIDSVIYSSPDGIPLWMDIYQPVGDTATLRPVVILAHGGSFMHGHRKSERIPIMCRMLAQRGYVAVSIDYRLTTLVGMASKPAAYKNILKSVADGRAAVSWLLKDIDNGNTYRIDKTKLFVGGSSAGAILTQQLAFIDSTAECTGTLCKQANRYLPDSLSLPPGTIKGMISLAGAVLDTGIIGNHQPALLHIHGDADRIVQYGYKRAVKGWAPFKMAGLGGSRQRYTSQKLNYTEYVFPNAGHTPWDRDDAMFEIVMHQVVEFLWREVR
ncbi:MAG TPA: alpha/beta hydrolase [Chitinophagales bacterium]|nr:alpha/beta hydrolase [Chitinophagales bacterium]